MKTPSLFVLRFAVLHFALTFFALLCAGRALADDKMRPELRAFWADGFNEGYKTPQQIDTLLQRLHDAHCNAVFAQMRKGGDAYYASHYEPWASDDTGHFDALACLIERAHRMTPRIAVHAWINTCAVGTGTKHPGYHVALLHPEWMSTNWRGNADDGEVRKIDLGNPDAADWTFRLYLDVARHYDVDGIHFDFVRYGSRRFGYNPVSVARFLRGLPPGYKMKPYMRNGVAQRFPPEQGLIAGQVVPAPDDPAWKQWRRDQVTNFVRKVYAFAAQIKPHLVVSAATIAWGNGPHNETEWMTKSAALNSVFQDWRGMQREGILDLACPMTYFGGRHGLEYERTWSAWIKAHQYGRASAIAVGNWQLTPPQTLAQMQIARSRDANGTEPYGVMLYSYAGTNLGVRPDKPGLRELELQPGFYALLSHPSPFANAPPFAADVPLPRMPWKEHPTRGILKGFVRGVDLRPVDGALVTLEAREGGTPRRYARRTDGTGFYAFVDLPPGAYQSRVSALPRDNTPQTTAASQITAPQTVPQEGRQLPAPETVTISAGNVTTGSFRLKAAPSPNAQTTSAVEILPDIKTASGLAGTASAGSRPPVCLHDLTVILGTDTYPGNFYVQDKQGERMRVRFAAPPAVPFQPGDVVSVIGTPTKIEEEPALDQAVACLNDISLLPDTSPIAPREGARSQDRNAGVLAAHAFVRVRGTVTRSEASAFTLTDAGGEQVIVPLAGRKDFGVEAGGLLASPPVVGSLATVAGLVQANLPGAKGAYQARILPRTAADIVVIASPPPIKTWRKIISISLALLLAILFCAFWYARRRRLQSGHKQQN